MIAAALIVLPHLSGIIAQYLTRNQKKEIYACVKRPKWNPSFWIATLTWAALYTCIGIASYLTWIDGQGLQGAAKFPLCIYALIVLLNLSWQLCYYNIQSLTMAALNLIVLTGVSGYCAILFLPINEMAFYLVLPYVVWIAFMSLLHITIWSMNRVRTKLE
ncbi:uncharacterized protein TRIADDRAFT_22177 [Trichoplax adhaerens]|uniref:Uncharacterized protein n=1 Tax=Trichoplax adhaerens TaxID=10228 RepID=B3RRN1_TRIAD|nr:hypothetical protein TRIADDRAFT_22177 [Trichoplax adhaerens]EDV26898.1 hypothetical protein TRIADDRAFT_22177 [Trichoplax adhaerens]|eukprot:XP_002110894.1 hypothetical protein TRIADDRAFT_22177 [Trichoplax adhaerens]